MSRHKMYKSNHLQFFLYILEIVATAGQQTKLVRQEAMPRFTMLSCGMTYCNLGVLRQQDRVLQSSLDQPCLWTNHTQEGE